MSRFQMFCYQCNAAVTGSSQCPNCGGVLYTRYERADPESWRDAAGLPGPWRYAPLLPVSAPERAVTMGEGQTPLVRSKRLGPSIGLDNLYFKLESLNPTGSYKDRIASVGLTRALEQGRERWIATSSGNAGAALAAYGARGGMTGVLLVPANAPSAKLSQIQAHRPHIIAIKGFGESASISAEVFDAVSATSRELSLEPMVTAHAVAPTAMDGAKTLAFELAEQFRGAPNRVYAPSGGGGLAASIIRGFQEWQELGQSTETPSVVVAQAAGCAPVVRSWENGTSLVPIEKIDTDISGVQLGAPPDGDLLLNLLRRHGGSASAVPDQKVFEAQAVLGHTEGIFVEPAAALSVASLIADRLDGRVAGDDSVVCVLTGTGFKDQGAVERMVDKNAPVVPISVDDLPEALREAVA